MATKIKFGTDGWRGIIANDFTNGNVARVAKATADWMKQQDPNSSVVLGYDCRFGGYLFCQTAINVFVEAGIKVYFDQHFVSTPMVSLGAKYLGCELGVIITASHNPPTYNGYKLKAKHGGPLIVRHIEEIEAMIPEVYAIKEKTVDELVGEGKVELVELEDIYFNHVKEHFDLEAINDSGFIVGYDAMYGAGQSILPRLLPQADVLHCEYNPGFYGQAPEPVAKNLTEFANYIKQMKHIDFGLCTDGDADRIGLFDAKGRFIDAHHIILMLIYVLHEYRELRGKVVIAFSVSDKVKKLCEHFGIEVEVTKIGFKYICEKMITEDVLVGGEESGGIAVKGHIPERDGIWDGLVLIDYLSANGLSVEDLINEIYAIVGPFAYNRLDLHLKEEQKQQIIADCKAGTYQSFGNLQLMRVEDIDGYKFHFANDEVVMIRPSGTEPVLRIYVQAGDLDRVNDIIEIVRKQLVG
ncbi:MAG: phosphoglucomutase/phosphomannomutase family protein [Bacteroidetes bacterium]|nr:phosphoglucomutase/phosphomannomutase family protein [Bacteroidota bacterium]